MQVCVPSTPAQMFHLLRRQMVRPVRKPLVVMTPKSLLRHKRSVSALEELSRGGFQNLIPERQLVELETVKRVVMCSGKVYYDLVDERTRREIDDVALLRIEQLYPFPQKALRAELRRYPNAKRYVWCQEEPRNQGAWYQIGHRLRAALKGLADEPEYAGRRPSAAPAVGIHGIHVEQQKRLVRVALGLADPV